MPSSVHPCVLPFLPLALTALLFGANASASAQASPSPTRSEAATRPARKGEDAEFKRTLNRAVAEFDLGHWAEARSLFERAHELQPSARTLRAIGLCAFENRSYAEAALFLTQALADPRKALDQESRTKLSEILEQTMNFVGRYTLEIEPKSATVRVNFASPIILDGKLLLDPGTHSLLLSAEGYKEAQHQLQAKGRDDEVLHIALVPLLPPVSNLSDGEMPTRAAAAAAPATQIDRSDSPGPRRRWYKNPWLWTTVGVLAVGGAASATLLLTREQTDSPKPYGGNTNAFLDGP